MDRKCKIPFYIGPALLRGLTTAFPFLFVLTFTSVSFPQIRCELVFGTSVSINKSNLLEKIWAVHATRILPKDGIVYAGLQPGGLKKSAIFRPEIHFALGELVVGHNAGLWDEMPYAILTPLRNLERQFYTLLPQDTVIIGDFVLTADTIILAPKGKYVPPQLKPYVSFYDLSTTTLREAVDQKIRELNGWRFYADGGKITSQVQFNGMNINYKSFFKDLFTGKDYLDFNLHSERDLGKIDGRISLLIDYFRRGLLEPPSDNEAKLEYASFIIKLEQSIAEIDRINLLPIEKEGVSRNIKYFKSFLNIFRLDLEFRSQGLGSLFGIKNKDIIAQIFELKEDPEKMKAFAFTQKSLFVHPSVEPLRHFDLFSHFKSWEEIKKALQLFPEFHAALGETLVIKALWHLTQKANWHHLVSNPSYGRNVLGIDAFNSAQKRLLENAGSDKEIIGQLQLALQTTSQFDFYFAHGFLSAFPSAIERQHLFGAYPQVKILFSRSYDVDKWLLAQSSDNPNLIYESKLKGNTRGVVTTSGS